MSDLKPDGEGEGEGRTVTQQYLLGSETLKYIRKAVETDSSEEMFAVYLLAALGSQLMMVDARHKIHACPAKTAEVLAEIVDDLKEGARITITDAPPPGPVATAESKGRLN